MEAMRMGLRLVPVLLCIAFVWRSEAAETNSPSYRDIDGPPHHYRTRTPRDRFTLAMPAIENDPRLDCSTEKAFLISFLKILGVPASSQMLVFSTTSLQLRFISPSNP